MVSILQAYGCMATANGTLESCICSSALAALVSAGVRLEHFSMTKMGQFDQVGYDSTLDWLVYEQDSIEVVLEAARLGSEVVPFSHFVAYDASRLDELLHTAAFVPPLVSEWWWPAQTNCI